MSVVCQDASQVVGCACSVWMLRSKNATLRSQRVARQLLCLVVLAFTIQSFGQIRHGRQRVGTLRPEHAALNLERLPKQILSLGILTLSSQGYRQLFHCPQGVLMLRS